MNEDRFDRIFGLIIFAVLWLIVLAYAGYQIGAMGDVGLRKFAVTHDKAVKKAEAHLRNDARDISYEGHTMAIYPVTVVILADEGDTIEQRLERL